MEPKDRHGNIIRDITDIATRNKNQLVIVDGYNKRVIVNDLMGNFLGRAWYSFVTKTCQSVSHFSYTFSMTELKLLISYNYKLVVVFLYIEIKLLQVMEIYIRSINKNKYLKPAKICNGQFCNEQLN